MTNDDFKKMVQTFVTKTEFDQRIEKLEERVATKDDFRQVMTVLDKVLKEVLAMRQEQTFHVQKHIEIDQRLGKLEEVTNISST